MIVKREWVKYNRKYHRKDYHMGFFLFGFIPLYVRIIRDVN